MSTTDARPHPHDGAPRVAVAITATSTPVLSHALAHNRVPVVSRLAFATHGTAVSGALVRIGVRDAEGPIGRPVELTVDLDADATTVLSDVDLVVDAAAVLQIEEQRPGVIEIDVTVDGADVGGTAVPVQVLAAGQWLAAPLPLALEMLAAHVLPNHPAVGALLEEAAALLGDRTGAPSLEGYAAGPERVDEVVAAVAAAVRARGVRYGEAAADWAHIAQKVRTPGDVLDGRVGTPLDTTVVLAAALEAAGVRTLLWLTEGIGGGVGAGHAFLGYWREERSAESAATTDVAPLADLVDLGLVRLVETTLLTSREPAEPDAEQLHRAARDAWLAGGPDRVLGVTDVHRARRDGILPLPARTRGPGGALQVVEYRPPAARPAGRHAAPAPGARAGVPARVRQWQDDLLGPAARDRLLHLPEGAGLPLVVPGLYLATLTELLAEEGGVALLPSDRLVVSGAEGGVRSARGLPVGVLGEVLHERRAVHADVTDGGYLPRLRGLAHRSRTAREETGAGDLHLAVGTLAWEQDGRRLRSPLVLLPVVLSPDGDGDGDGYRLTADPTAGASPNGLLLDELRRAHGLTVPGLDPVDGTDVDGALDAVRQALAEAGLPFRVEATADLALLRPAGHRRWRDLDASWAELTAAPLVDHLARAAAAPFRDPVPAAAVDVDLDELAARCPLPADSSQLRAVAEGVAGRTFVLEGAPGTGKSQTVVNLVARAVAEGRRVLVVAAKRAALDVVARRLEAVGLGGATLPLHDERARPAEVRARVLAALDGVPQEPADGGAADDGAADLADLRAARRTLARYADRLHAPNAAGLSCYSARTAQLALGDGVPPLPLPPAFAAAAPAETMAAVRRALALLPDVADLVRPSPRHPWAFVDTAEVDLRAAHAAACAVDAAMRALPAEEHLARALREVRTPGDLDDLAHLLAGPPVGLDVLDEVPTARWTAATTAVLAEVAAFTSAVHPGLELATPEALALPLADLYVAAQTAQAARTWARRQGLRAVRDQLAPVLRPGVTVKLGDVPELTASLWRLQTAAAGLAARAAVIPGLSVPAGWNPLLDPTVLDGQVAWLRRAGAVVDSARGFAVALRRHVVARPGTDAAAATAVRRLRDELDRLLRVCRSTPARLAEWCGDDGVLLRWAMTRPERGVEHSGLISLRRWAEFLDTLEPLRAAGLTEARAALVSGRLPAEDATRALEHGLAAASAAERHAATGLDAFDADAHDRALARHTAASRAVRRRLVAALPAAVAARRPEEGERVAALRRALDPTDDAPGVRALLAGHGDLVTAVLPCVLAGPDAVARFLPARAGLFDLVVVDEASQLRVADAVGALGRARAAVVVGDPRQLPPAPPAESGPAAGEDLPGLPGTAVEDAESVLSECLRAGVPRHRLSWHYRSRDESLFAFSNAHYYGNRLSSFPAPAAGRPSADVGGHGISLVRVQGTFHRTGAGRLLRTNPMEAKAVVAEIRRRLDADPDAVPSIGVVTFTAQQRAYVESLLRDAGDERLTAALERTDGEGVFVKDIEDVQGDERDVVLLSTAYSADDRGVLPLNFGPLNRAGGERRLNVAITRARRQVVVFTSFDPTALRAEQTSSLGVKHLRAYLDLAALGTDALPREARAPRVPDRHREEIAAALRGRGLGVRTDVGLSDCRVDLALARADAPDTPVVAVLLDGPAWARRPTVGDRDGLPAEVLSGVLGWPAVERVWLPAWLRDREAVLDRLVAAVAAVPAPAAAPPALSVVEDVPAAEPTPVPDPAPGSGPAARVPVLRSVASAAVAALPAPRPLPAPATDEPAPVTPPVTLSVVPPVPEEPPADEATPAPVEQRFRTWAPKPAGDRKVLDGLVDPRNARLVTRVLAAGLRAEGPVHRDRLVRLAAGAFGLTRVGEARRDALLALLPAHTLDGDVVWPASLDPATWTVYRRQSASSVRPLEQVPAQEVGNAMVALCREAGGLGHDELFLRTAEVFGYRRRTPSLAPLLTAALDRAAASGRLTVHDDGRVTA
ncbi:Protein of unknown function [Geodermatophilus saharensis]|uniref:Uncharacterized protein n=1 Tax=Geodermatophilus saharensis TaxID=1137994 RepID=A0A239EDS6_9ACTN|nr:DUF3320 domain-containing protein [Geodermatophilus saharensis]SNS42153.1 Protein of unknown function [Geodermatophilus saharensis]